MTKWVVALAVMMALLIGGFAGKAIASKGKCCGLCPTSSACPCNK